ncbi:MAG: Asp-tRNA(Asn)/Glu-tRNA(Gln) amidotransferase subunit GatA, partial [Candidatus Binatia bacterium]
SERLTDVLKVAHAWEPHIHAFLHIFDHETPGGSTGALAGVPIAIKDNICTTTGNTTAASRILETFSAPFEATVVGRLKKAGAVLIGKTNLDEFAMGSSTEYSAFGPTRNPWNMRRVAGGSSGGSVAAVAAGVVPAALGSDTGGSIRQPASFCGVVGLKPTYGRVSRFGLIAYGSSLDQIGPITRTVKDAATLLEIIAGRDARDATSSPERVPHYAAACGQAIDGLRIGVPEQFFSDHVATEVREAVDTAISSLKEQGAKIMPISLPHTDAAVAVYFLIAKAEASTNLARYDALRFAPLNIEVETLTEQYVSSRGKGFGPEVKRAIIMGTYALSAGYYEAWYKQASKVRTLIRNEYAKAFQEVDVIAGPVSPEVAFELGSKTDDPLQMYLADALTVPMSVAGIPALSVPCGVGRESRMPVGLQLSALHFREEVLFRVGHAYEAAHDWWNQVPSLP